MFESHKMKKRMNQRRELFKSVSKQQEDSRSNSPARYLKKVLPKITFEENKPKIFKLTEEPLRINNQYSRNRDMNKTDFVGHLTT